MFKNLKARHYSILILLAIVALETSAIAIDRFLNRGGDVAFELESSFQNNNFIERFQAAQANLATSAGLKTIRTSTEMGSPPPSRPAAAKLENTAEEFATVTAPAVQTTVQAPFIAAANIPGKAVNLIHYSVRQGDSLSRISNLFGVSLESIKQENNLSDKDSIRAGQTLKLPVRKPEIVYTVKPGDSLSKVANTFGVSLQALLASNNLRTHALREDQKLTIPVTIRRSKLSIAKPDNLQTNLAAGNTDKLDNSRSAGRLTLVRNDNRPEIAAAAKPRLQIVKSEIPSKPPVLPVPKNQPKQAKEVVAAKAEENSGQFHLVTSRDTLSTIARRYGTTIQALRANNGISGTTIVVGQRLALQPQKVGQTPKAESAKTETVQVAAIQTSPVPATAPALSAQTATNAVNHVVKPGESLSVIAKQYETTVARIVKDNKISGTVIQAGQSLRIQPGNRLYRVVAAKQKNVQPEPAPISKVEYLVAKGDTLSQLAKRYNTTVAQIVSTNNLSSTMLNIGQKLEIHKNQRRYNVSNVTSTRTEQMRFRWPTRGRISDGYGWRKHPVYKRRLFHAGIDIAAPRGTPIEAAADGEVIFAGWRSGYGKLVILRHKNGYTTRYAHCSAIRVRRGQMVKAGQRVAQVGATGVATGNHLHFEVRRNGKHVNPRLFLR